MNVHLIDGTYELFRMYFGAPPATSPEGMEVGATRALLRSFAAMLRSPKVTHIGVAFDHVIESFRNELFDGYKTGEGMDPALYAQFPLAERAVSSLGMTVWPMERFEADDGLASAAAKYAEDPRVSKVLICSPDKDLAQCVVKDRIVCFDRRKKKLMNEDGVVEKFGVGPASIPDYLALVGDSADGIPGIPRWGAKGAAEVLAHYKHLEHIPDDPTDWKIKVRGAKTLAGNLAYQRKDAMLYRELATLRLDAPIPEALEAIRWKEVDLSALEELAAELGDSGVLNRLPAARAGDG
ncbi:MAG: 5'-3' exonuclease H3TH domain-containing protein [Myxococcota bacterium]